MAQNIQIRSVPQTLHQKLKAKAALNGKTLTDFLLQELRLIAARPTVTELKERILSRKPVSTKMSPSNILRMERIR